MRCRLYVPGSGDARILDGFLNHNRDGDVRLVSDRIVCAVDENDRPAGCLVWRPAAFIHEFHLPPVLGQRSVADSLFSGAVKLDFNRRHLIRQAVFMVDNDNLPMLRYLRDNVRAVEQNGTIFLLNLQAPGALTDESDGPSGQSVKAG